MKRSRLRWQCRRGMRELDALLGGYLERCYDAAADDEKSAFETVLELPDPELVAYLLQGRQAPTNAMARVLARILDQSPA